MTWFEPQRMISRTAATLALAGFAILGACDTEGGTQLTNGPDAAPALPEATSMSVDFGLFQIAGAPTVAAFDGQSLQDLVALGESVGNTQLHFAAAALSVLVAQAVTIVQLAVPTAVFAAAANNTPSFEEDGRWHWRYSASHGGQLWTAHLSGVVDGNMVDWDMRITAPNANPPLDDFLWYGGISRTDHTSGTWRFYDPSNPSNLGEVVRLDWTHESSDVHGVTITVTGGDNVGDVLTADHSGSTRLVTFFDASKNENVEIFWDVATGEGYIIAPGLNGGTKSCWDSSQNDMLCA